MKITAFNGSPRMEKGNTNVMVTSLLKGAERGGAEIENIMLPKYKIFNCTGCFSCWHNIPGKCVINDDMEMLLKKYMESEVVIMASPLYYDFVTGLMKTFMDRMLPLVCHDFEIGETDELRHLDRYEKNPSVVWVSNCGFPENSHFDVMKVACERDSSNHNVDIIAMIFRGQGPLLTNNNPGIIEAVENYKKLLDEAGYEIAMKRKVSAELIEKLHKPLIPEKEYAANFVAGI